MEITTIGIDLAKNVFQIHGVDERGKAVLRKQLKRDQVAPFFANMPPCNDPGESAQIRPLMRRLPRVFACPAPDAVAEGCRN